MAGPVGGSMTSGSGGGRPRPATWAGEAVYDSVDDQNEAVGRKFGSNVQIIGQFCTGSPPSSCCGP